MAWRALVAKAVQAVAGRSRAGQCFSLAASPPEVGRRRLNQVDP
jgi:hypothetical protein